MLVTARDNTQPATARGRGGSQDPPLLARLRRIASPSWPCWRCCASFDGAVRLRLDHGRPDRRRGGSRAVRHRLAVQALELGRRAEAESFARILQGLSRSVSPDHIVDAIVEELGVGTGADHIVVVRRRPDLAVLEATLVNARTGGPPSSTLFPISDLEDVSEAPEHDRRQPVAIPIEAGRGSGARRERRGRGRRRRRSPGPRDPRRSLLVPLRPRPRRRQAAAPHRRRPHPWPSRSQARSRSRQEADLVAERIAARARRVYGLKHTLAAPLTAGSAVIGAIVVSRRTADAWPASAQRILAGAAVEASAALSRAYSHRQAEARATTDALTGLPNRRYFDEFCALLARRRRAEDAIGILMVDIDRFKAAQRRPRSRGRRRGAPRRRRRDRRRRPRGRRARHGSAARSSPSCCEPAHRRGVRGRRAHPEAVAALDLSRQGVAATSVSGRRRGRRRARPADPRHHRAGRPGPLRGQAEPAATGSSPPSIPRATRIGADRAIAR